MGENELRDALLDLYPEDMVDEFLERVSGVNEVATTRIARANRPVVVESTDETPTEEPVERTTEEVVEEVETVVEETETETEVVEEEQETGIEVEAEVEEEEETVIELGETFVDDLVGSVAFNEALRSAIAPIIEAFRAEVETKFRSLEQAVVAEQEYVQDKPARTKRAVVSYRAQNAATVEVPEPAEKTVRTYEDIAKENVKKIFGEA